MAKKKDQESKKSRKNSSISKEASSTSPNGGGDIVPPPNPSATHLVASNPFDDPPAMNMGPGYFPNQHMVHLQAPAGGIGPYPGWTQRGDIRGMRPYGPGGWGPMHANNGMPSHPNYHPNMPPNPNMPGNGYNINRPHYAGPVGVPQFRGSPRMHMNNIRPGSMGPLGSPGADGMMIDQQNMGPGMMVSSGNQGHMLGNTGQMKALTRPTPAQLQSPNTTGRKNSTSSNKTEGKSPKTSEPSAKSRKKSEKKAALEAKKSEQDKSAGETNIIPHSVLPTLPQLCKSCSVDITSSSEEVICCLASCQTWYHRTCVGLTEQAYKYLKSEELAIWACDNCLQTKEIFSVLPKSSLDHLT